MASGNDSQSKKNDVGRRQQPLARVFWGFHLSWNILWCLVFILTWIHPGWSLSETPYFLAISGAITAFVAFWGSLVVLPGLFLTDIVLAKKQVLSRRSMIKGLLLNGLSGCFVLSAWWGESLQWEKFFSHFYSML